MPWNDTATALAAFFTPATLAGVAKGALWLRDRAAKAEAARIAEAVAAAQRHAAEAAYRERMLADVSHVRARVDEAHATIGEVRSDLAETREHVAELRGAQGRAGRSGLHADTGGE